MAQVLGSPLYICEEEPITVAVKKRVKNFFPSFFNTFYQERSKLWQKVQCLPTLRKNRLVLF